MLLNSPVGKSSLTFLPSPISFPFLSLFFIHRKWREYQQVIREEVSNTEDVNISWVRFFTGVFLIVNFSFLISLFAVIHLDIMRWLWKSVGVILSLSIFALGYKGILQK